MKDIFAFLCEQMKLKTRDFPADDFLIRGLWKTDLLFRPSSNERTFNYTYVLAQTVGQGCCYCPSPVQLDHATMGTDAREILHERNPVSIAVLDSILARISRQPQEVHNLCCDSVEKARLRTEVILREAERLLPDDKGAKARIVNVGVVGELLRRLKEKYQHVTATDFDEVIVGLSLHGVPIDHGSLTLEHVREADLAIVTGMTLATGTLEGIIETARSSGTRLVVFAETGGNFGEEYCRGLGVDAVVSEPFPFYIFQGATRIEVYRKE
jgi:hypothetical protein